MHAAEASAYIQLYSHKIKVKCIIYSDSLIGLCHSKTLGCRVKSRQKKPWRWTPVRTSVQSCLRGKLSCCGNRCSEKSSSQCASDSRHSGHKHWFSKDDLARTLLMTKILCTIGSPNAWPKMEDCRRETSSENLNFMQLNWNLFVKRIVTGDETWIHHYDPERNQNLKIPVIIVTSSLSEENVHRYSTATHRRQGSEWCF